MSHIFFSYSRNDTGNTWLQQFYKDLVNEVRQKDGTIPSTRPDGEVVFLDTTEIPVGTDWKKELVDGLQNCRALVAVYSPGYFNSEYCGKEFGVFQRRLAAVGAKPPPLIFPVLWEINERVRTTMSRAVSGIQYTHGNFAKEYGEEGLNYLMRQDKQQYEKFLHYFTKTMADALAANGAVPQLNPFPKLDQVDSAWQQAQGPLPQSGQSAALSGPGTAQFFFVAGSDVDYAPIRQQRASYNGRGGRFWSPYQPPSLDQVQHISYKAADAAKVNYVDEVVDQKLIQRIRDAEKENTIVVLVVDPWSVRVQSYQQLLDQCDGAAFLNCGVIVPWNDNDAECASARDALRDAIKRTFKRTLKLKHIYFKDGIQSADELQKELYKAILEIRARLMQETPEVRAAENAEERATATASLPVVYGPGGVTS